MGTPRPTIAVLGAADVGQAMAADLGLAGADVVLCDAPRQPESPQPAATSSSLELISQASIGRSGVTRVNLTRDVHEAVTDADYVFVTIPPGLHAHTAELCAPHLVDGQVVVIFTGCGGALVFLRALRRRSTPVHVLIGETSTPPYIATITAPGQIALVGQAYRCMPLAAVPVRDTDRLFARIQSLYPLARPAASVLETVLLDVRMARHIVVTLLNAGRVEQAAGPMRLFLEGYTPSVWRVFHSVDQERRVIMAALGLQPVSFLQHRWSIAGYTSDEAPRAYLDLALLGDAGGALVLWADLGRSVGAAVPTCESLIHLSSTITGRDLMSEGRTLASLGLAGLRGMDVRDAVDQGRVV